MVCRGDNSKRRVNTFNNVVIGKQNAISCNHKTCSDIVHVKFSRSLYSLSPRQSKKRLCDILHISLLMPVVKRSLQGLAN